MDVGESRRGGRGGSRIVMVGDVRVMGALDVAPCHRLLVTIRVIGDDVKVGGRGGCQSPRGQEGGRMAGVRGPALFPPKQMT